MTPMPPPIAPAAPPKAPAGQPARKTAAGTTPRERWSVFSRVVAGFGLAYGFTWLFTGALAVVLPAWFGLARAHAVLVATQWSFMVYTLVVVWAFSVRRLRTVWWGLLLGCAACAGLLAWLREAA